MKIVRCSRVLYGSFLCDSHILLVILAAQHWQLKG